ncbi:MAG: flagellar hook-length control protein FliK [Sphingomonadales bacterium]|nr:MAG: flagellar hook-length control protein FliK [Sphingomonadales bacterium]
MSVDMLTSAGGAGKTGSVLSLSGSGKGKAGSGGGALGDFASMMEAQVGVTAPAAGQDISSRGKSAKQTDATIGQAVTGKTGAEAAEAATVSAISGNGKGQNGVRGESKENAETSPGTRRRKSTDEKRVVGEGDGGDRAGAATPALALIVSADLGATTKAAPNAGKAEKVDGGGVRGRSEGRAVSALPAAQAGTVASGDIAGDAAIAEAIPASPAMDDGTGTASAVVSEPGAGEGPDDDAPVANASRPAHPGEATALLDMVKSDLPGKAEGAARTPDRQAGAMPSGRSSENAASAATPAAPAMEGDNIPVRRPGVAVATEQASDRAQPVIARVAERLADQTIGMSVRSKRDQAAMQVSPLAIATAQSVVAGQGAEGTVMGHDGEPVSQDTGNDGALLSTGVSDGRGTGRGDMGLAAPAASPDILSSTGSAASAAVNTGLGVTPSLSLSGVGATLGQQVIDMGVSGQWIDDIAREIAGMASNPGHGSFRIASPTLGMVQVEIAPGTDGADVRMTVDNEAAQAALSKDQARLVQDAQMAAVRIGDVRIDRIAPAADTQRGDMGQNGGQNGQNSGGQQAQASFAQSGGQGNQSGTRQDMMGFGSGGAGGNSGDNSPKSSFTRTVIRDVAAMDSAAAAQGKADSARYA